MLSQISNYIFPIFLFFIFLYSFIKKNDTLSSFVKGARDGISTVFGIVPNILAIMVATAVFRSSGALNFVLFYITPVLTAIKIPAGIIELIILRPISGSGAMVLLSDIYKNFTPDSYEGILASVIAASTETTVYTVMVYFGVTGVRKTAIPLITGLLADVCCVIISVLIVNMFIF